MDGSVKLKNNVEATEESKPNTGTDLATKVFGNEPLNNLEQRSTQYVKKQEREKSFGLKETLADLEGLFKNITDEIQKGIESAKTTFLGIVDYFLGKNNEQTPEEVSVPSDIESEKISKLYSAFPGIAVSEATFQGYYTTILEAVKKLGGNPSAVVPLVLSFFHIESKFNNGAKNTGSGATGLGQHVPRFWTSRADKLVKQKVFKKKPDISNAKAQIYATVQLVMDNAKSLPPKLKADPAANYLIYNSGGSHAWIAKHGLMNKPEELQRLFEMTPEEREKKYSGSKVFREYALKRLTAPNTVFNRAANLHKQVVAAYKN